MSCFKTSFGNISTLYDTDFYSISTYSVEFCRHNLRHSSTTYKLKLNKGDLKATQGDTGHAQVDMITDIYAHILDEDRKINAQKFETAFYSNPDMRPIEQKLQEAAPATLQPELLIKQLESNPQFMNAFTQKFIEQFGNQIVAQLATTLTGA